VTIAVGYPPACNPHPPICLAKTLGSETTYSSAIATTGTTGTLSGRGTPPSQTGSFPQTHVPVRSLETAFGNKLFDDAARPTVPSSRKVV
jgi:hypothetical protein